MIATQQGTPEKSANAEHAWENHHPIEWEETSAINEARRLKKPLLKEVIHSKMTLSRSASTGMQDWSFLTAGCQPFDLRRKEQVFTFT